MTRREQLDAYEEAVTREWSAPRAFAALRDVLDAHRVVRRGGLCRACTWPSPCATVRMITKALETP